MGAERYGAARIGTTSVNRFARRKIGLHFYAELDNVPSPSWEADIDQVVFRGSFAVAEVAFFRRISRTANPSLPRPPSALVLP